MSKKQIKASGAGLLDNIVITILIFGLISGGISILVGITVPLSAGSLLMTGIATIFLSVVIFAFAKNVSSINQNLEVFKEYQKAEYRESLRMREEEHFDPKKV